MINWADVGVAIWNGADFASAGAPPVSPRPTPWDSQAIYTGSASVVDGAGPGGVGPGVINLYPGLCTKAGWPGCDTGTVLAQAVPADYANDVLLENWTKPAYNPVLENAQRDPASPWKTVRSLHLHLALDTCISHAATASSPPTPPTAQAASPCATRFPSCRVTLSPMLP